MAQARIGLLPLPLFLALLTALAVAIAVPEGGEQVSGLLLPVLGGFMLAEIGGRIPWLRNAGLDTVLVLLVPSWLASAGLLPDGTLMALRRLLEATDAVGFFVTVLIVGSVMSIERAALPTDTARLMALLAGGTAAALVGGLAAAMLLDRPAIETLALTLAPAMAGGLSAGAIPLSVAYADALGAPQSVLLARMLPPLIAANLLAILFAGAIALVERQHDRMSAGAPRPSPPKAPTPVTSLGRLAFTCAGLVVLHLISSHVARSSGWAAPLIVLLLAALLRLADPLTAGPRQDVVVLYRRCLQWLIHPVLFIAGALFTPWAQLVEGFSPFNLLPVAAAVGGMVLAGAALARPLGLAAADGAVLALTRAAMGGTGTIAILNASRRLRLMPQAQILTRIGGALTLALAMAAIGALDP
ncbi:2-hydroxycarboxylate transporter family protein [Bosea sp. BK604]|uniref:2-hydroxycarboxylate transporter family protein n=1 Tax=Bosea sp. BK604 TaxID=2512180 RepID=UPI001404F921|nr:2-hydroxycarboxylate transporter family protein [Bosea sp. BK604]